MLYQPPSAARPYWDAMVKRMKAVFKAPIDDADMPEIVDYLVEDLRQRAAEVTIESQPACGRAEAWRRSESAAERDDPAS